jgi:hypothetical protein
MQIRKNTTVIEVWQDGTIGGACAKFLKLLDPAPGVDDRINIKRIGKDGEVETISGNVNQVWWDYDTPHGYTLLVAIGGEYDRDGVNFPWNPA